MAGFTERQRTVTFAAMVNVFLVAGKTIGGLMGHSSALLADALDSLTDLVGDIVVLGGLWIAEKPADDSHPFGHYKAESIVTTIAGLIIVGSAVLMLARSIHNLAEHTPTIPQTWTALIALASVIICAAVYAFLHKRNKELGSPGIEAAAAHKLADSFTSVAAFIGIVASSLFNIPWGDTVASGIVSLWVMRTGLKITFRGGHELLDGAPGVAVEREILSIAMETPGVTSVRKIRTRSAGGRIFAEMDITTSKELSITNAHVIAHRVRDNLIAKITFLNDVVVHIEPSPDEDSPQDIIKTQAQKILSASKDLRGFHRLAVLSSENGCILVVDIVVPPDITVRNAHHISDDLRQRLLAIPKLADAILHIDYNRDEP